MKEFSKHVQDAAEMFLKRRGYEILDANWECPDGEGKFDIIADDEDSIVFVQVKGRDGRVDGFGFDEATMQRDDFERMSMSYLAENPDICNCAVRFDVVAITVDARMLESWPGSMDEVVDLRTLGAQLVWLRGVQ